MILLLLQYIKLHIKKEIKIKPTKYITITNYPNFQIYNYIPYLHNKKLEAVKIICFIDLSFDKVFYKK